MQVTIKLTLKHQQTFQQQQLLTHLVPTLVVRQYLNIVLLIQMVTNVWVKYFQLGTTQVQYLLIFHPPI